jgi:hypothetical protein
LQDLARVGGGDFSLSKSGATSYQFNWHDGQLGTDRSATLVFSVAHGNMARPVYRHKRSDERTVAVVAGEGEAAERDTVIRTGANYAAGNDIELFVDARDLDSTAAYNARGDQKLDEAEARAELAYTVLQTPASAYGKHYGLGDLAGYQFGALNGTHKVMAVHVSIDGDGQRGREVIDVEMADE